MPHAFRHFCIGLCVALLAAMNMHGVSQSQHAVDHAADWPSVALSEVDDDQHTVHVHVAPDEMPDTGINQDADGAPPVGHHHHAGGDVQTALPAVDRGVTKPLSASALQWPGSDPALAGLGPDGPEYPPKRMRTVV